MRTVGIDLSANPLKTGVCIIEWQPFTITVHPRPLTDDEIVDEIARSDFAAIDVPLGWPDAFVEAVVSHRDYAGWPVVDVLPPGDRERLRFRLTDLVTRAAGSQPLSVSTDRIGVAAMRGARLQHLLVAAGITVDRSGTSGRLCETYPAAVLRRWGLMSTSYKTQKNDAARRRLVEELAARCGDRAHVIREALIDADDDDLDAVICALAAREVLEGRSTQPGPEQIEIARREGWIHLPDKDLESVVGR